MALDPEAVRRIARLARIHVDDDDVARLRSELTGILAWVEQLDEVDVTGVAPLAGGASLPLAMRDDVVTEGGNPEAILGNAPERAGDFFTVPKVVE
jgi:aspartyl-tRNA(Asn)/glutamyl-tRNA(Gln) amidotransferase subunit C